MKRSLPLLLVAVPLLAACAATTKQASWTNPEKSGQKIGSAFIIGAARVDLTRRLFEDELARRLAAAGVRGVTSYQHLGLEALEDKQVTIAKVKELGADTVIIAKVVDERAERVVNPGYTQVRGAPYYPSHLSTHWHDYYRSSYSVISQPPTVTDYHVATVETNLYGADGGMIWSMRTETTTVAGEVSESTIKEFVGIVVKDLAANGLL